MALLFVFSTGCTSKYKERATVKGKVTFNKQALNGGNVQFTASDNRTGVATIKEDGTYEMPDAPVGEVTITVTIPAPGGMSRMKGMPGGVGPKEVKAPEGVVGGTMKTLAQRDPSKTIQLPKAVAEKYGKAESSPLKYTVARGEHTHDIDLVP
jgi:hypothetical protein